MESHEIEHVEYRICAEFLDQGKDIPDGQIVKYLTECFPDNCFAYNYSNGCKFDNYNEELYNHFRYEILNWCGCGQPEEADKQVLKYLNLIDIPWREKDKDFDEKYANYKKLCTEYFGCSDIYENPLLLCLAYTLDAVGFTEHGSGIGGAWIMPKGKIYRYAIQKHLELEEETI